MITVLELIYYLLSLLSFLIVASAVLSWLTAFNVINLRNPTVRALNDLVRKLTEPLYRPVRRILPDTGMLDLAPLVVLLILVFLRMQVIPALAARFASTGF